MRAYPDASVVGQGLLGCGARLTREGGKARLTSQQGIVVQIAHPVVAAAIEELGARWPGLKSSRELERQVARTSADAAALSAGLFELFCAGFLEQRFTQPRCVNEVSARPLASELARHQAAAQRTVTNQLHVPVELGDPAARELLQLLDGAHDEPTLLAAWGKPDATAGELNRYLQDFAKLALLVA